MNIIQCAVEFAEENPEKNITLLFDSQEKLNSEVSKCCKSNSWITATWERQSSKKGYCIIGSEAFCGNVRVVAFVKGKTASWRSTEIWYPEEISKSEAERLGLSISNITQKLISFQEIIREVESYPSNTVDDDTELNEFIASLSE